MRIDHRIIITGIMALMIIEIVLILCDHDEGALTYVIVAAIGLSIGAIIPGPRIDNKRGVLVW